MAATLVYVSDVHNAALAALAGPGGFPAGDVHDGEVKDPTLIVGTDQVQPYAVVWTAPGDNPDRAVCGPDGGAELRLHVTVAASTQGKVLDAYDRARSLLDGAWLTVGGHQIGLAWLPGYSAPPPTRDPDVAGDRWFLPLIFTALI